MGDSSPESSGDEALKANSTPEALKMGVNEPS